MDSIVKQLQELSLESSDVDESGGGGDSYHANSISRLIEERKKSVEDKIIALRDERKIKLQKEVADLEQFKNDLSKKYPSSSVEKILEELDDLEDKKKLLNSMKEWEQGLLSSDKRTKFLFALVAPILSKDRRDLTFKNLLNCRNVCKEWKKGVDNLLQQVYKEAPIGFPTDSLLAESDFNFSSPEKVERFLQSFPQNSDSNPFFSRSVVLQDILQFPLQKRDSRNHLMTFLDRWGKEIWRLSVEFSSLPIEGKICLTLETLKTATQNLKQIHIHAEDAESFCRHPDIRERVNETKKLKTKWSGLELGIFSNLPIELTSAMIGPNRLTLTTISILKNVGDVMEALKCGPFPKLEVLTIVQGGSPNLILNSSCSDNFNSLKEMELMYDCRNHSDVVNVVKNVNTIGKRNLQRLTLKLFLCSTEGYYEKDQTLLWFHLPKLEKLDMYISGQLYRNLDFLLPLQSLKEFHLLLFSELYSAAKESIGDENTNAPFQSAEIINFSEGPQGYCHRMYESNIWVVLPELQTVTIQLVGETDITCYNYSRVELIKQKGNSNDST